MAFCSKEQTVHFVEVHGTISGIYEFMSEEFKRTWFPQLVRNASLIEELHYVRCKPPRDLFSELGIQKGLLDIDIWVLDIEGAEIQALHGTDFDKINVRMIMMECDGGGTNQRDREKIDFLASKNFACKIEKRNCFCPHASLVPSSRASVAISVPPK